MDIRRVQKNIALHIGGLLVCAALVFGCVYAAWHDYILAIPIFLGFFIVFFIFFISTEPWLLAGNIRALNGPPNNAGIDLICGFPFCSSAMDYLRIAIDATGTISAHSLYVAAKIHLNEENARAERAKTEMENGNLKKALERFK